VNLQVKAIVDMAVTSSHYSNIPNVDFIINESNNVGNHRISENKITSLIVLYTNNQNFSNDTSASDSDIDEFDRFLPPTTSFMDKITR
jgi:hypothetical protein